MRLEETNKVLEMFVTSSKNGEGIEEAVEWIVDRLAAHENEES